MIKSTIHSGKYNWFLPAASCPLPKAQSALRFALCVFLALAMQVHAQEATSELVAKIQEHYDQTWSLSADFVQKTRSRATSLGTSATGKLYFLKPRAIRWDYVEPRQQFVISDDKAWLYVPDEKTIYLYQIEQIVSSPLVLSFFSGLGQLSEMFTITRLPPDPDAPTHHRLELLPRESDTPVSRVTLWVAAESYQVVRVQTEDLLGNINEITLSNIQVDATLKPSWFALQVPEGVKLERQEPLPAQ